MSIQDERELSERLGDLLGGVDPRPAPVDLAVRQGRGIKRRRYAALAVGLAVVAAGAVLGPTVLRSQLSAPPVGPRHVPRYNVTVSPPPRGAGPGEIAIGSVNGLTWQATLSGTGKNVAVSFGGRLDFSAMALGAPSLMTDPANFDSEGGSKLSTAYVGQVSAATRYLTVTLSNGEMLTLRPQLWAGYRYAAMVVPQELRVIRAVAYGAHGELSYAIPFNYDGSAVVQTWLQPGQTGLAADSAQIGAGGSGQSRWTATAFVGPWGLCVRDSAGGGFCQAAGHQSGIGLVSAEFGGGAGNVEVGLARYDVAYLLITKSDGSVIRVEVDHVGAIQYGLVAMIQPRPHTFTGWVAYDQRNRRLGSGPGDPLGSFR